MTTRFYATTKEEQQYEKRVRGIFHRYFGENNSYEIEDLDNDNHEKTKPDFIVKCHDGSEVVVELKCLLTETEAKQHMKLQEPFHHKLSKLEYPYLYRLTCHYDDNPRNKEVDYQIALIKKELKELHPIPIWELPKHFRLGGSREQERLEREIKECEIEGKDASTLIRTLNDSRELDGNDKIAFSLWPPSMNGTLQPLILSNPMNMDIRHDIIINRRLNKAKKQTIDFHGLKSIVLAINDSRTFPVTDKEDLKEFFLKENKVFGSNARKWLSAIVFFNIDYGSINNIRVIHNNNAEVKLPESFLRDPGCIHYRFDKDKNTLIEERSDYHGR